MKNMTLATLFVAKVRAGLLFSKAHTCKMSSSVDAQCGIWLMEATSGRNFSRGGLRKKFVKFEPLKSGVAWSKRVRFTKFQNWLPLLTLWHDSEPSKHEIRGLGEPAFWSKPGFLLKISEIGKNAVNLKNSIYPSGRLVSMVVNIINLPQEKEFWKNIRPQARYGD